MEFSFLPFVLLDPTKTFYPSFFWIGLDRFFNTNMVKQLPSLVWKSHFTSYFLFISNHYIIQHIIFVLYYIQRILLLNCYRITIILLFFSSSNSEGVSITSFQSLINSISSSLSSSSYSSIYIYIYIYIYMCTILY